MLKIIKLLFFTLVTSIKFNIIGFIPLNQQTIIQAINEWNKYNTLIEIVNNSPNKITSGFVEKTISVAQTETFLNKKIITIDVNRIPFQTTLYNIVLHELGHSLGMNHNENIKSIMNYSVNVDKNLNAMYMPIQRLGLIDRCLTYKP
jgi:predicted Zn-dependent protease